jgi:ligand-binding SRPBCC domain-containing protein
MMARFCGNRETAGEMTGVAADYTLQRETLVHQPISTAFDFFSKAENLERITPPWLHFQILRSAGRMHPGATIAYRLRVRRVPVKWLTEIERWSPPFEFVDVQLRGPYTFWRHTHRFFEVEDGTRIVDIVNYSLPFGPLGRLVHWLQVRSDLAKIFDYREERIRTLLG